MNTVQYGTGTWVAWHFHCCLKRGKGWTMSNSSIILLYVVYNTIPKWKDYIVQDWEHRKIFAESTWKRSLKSCLLYLGKQSGNVQYMTNYRTKSIVQCLRFIIIIIIIIIIIRCLSGRLLRVKKNNFQYKQSSSWKKRKPKKSEVFQGEWASTGTC